jgi:hypothetical protein
MAGTRASGNALGHADLDKLKKKGNGSVLCSALGCRRPAGELNPRPQRSKHRAEKDERLDEKTGNRPTMATGSHARGKIDSTPEQKTSRGTDRESTDRSNRNWIQPRPQATDQVRTGEKGGLTSNSN